MLQWSFFYTILKIPDTVEDPTAYQLLSLDPGSIHSPKKIAQVLESQKRILRQHIPNPQFIPMLVTFETELDQAAVTLSDPAKREAYDRELLQQSSTEDSQAILNRKQSAAKARKAVADALNDNGEIDDDKRDLLINQLKELGLQSSLIKQLLTRIPSAPKASDINIASFRKEVENAITQGLISFEDENTLMEMGVILGFSKTETQQIINDVLQGKETKPAKPETAPTPRIWKTPQT